MKRFCSQCGKELEKNILICPKCGFKNKNKNKKKRNKRKIIIPIIIVAILIFLGVAGYIFRGTIIENIGNPLEMINRVQDSDYHAKQEFKETYEKYWVEFDSHWSMIGINLTEDNASYFDTEGYEVNGSTKLTTEELIIEKSSLLNKMNENNCYTMMNIDKECNKLLEKYTKINRDIWLKVDNKRGEWRFCDGLHLSDPRWDHVIPTCEKALNWEYEGNTRSCDKCDQRRQELMTISARMKDSKLAEDLLVLTESLKNYNKIQFQLTTARNEEQNLRRSFSQNSYRIYQIKQMSESEVRGEFQKDNYSLELLFFENTINKGNLTEFYTERWENKWDNPNLNEAWDKISEYSNMRDKLFEEITDYVLILNGLYDLNLSTPY